MGFLLGVLWERITCVLCYIIEKPDCVRIIDVKVTGISLYNISVVFLFSQMLTAEFVFIKFVAYLVING